MNFKRIEIDVLQNQRLSITKKVTMGLQARAPKFDVPTPPF